MLFATVGVRLGQLLSAADEAERAAAARACRRQLLIAIYGGYFGGGIGFLMLAALTAAGLAIRNAGATKNVLAGVMNASAVAIFVFSPMCTGCQAGIACARRHRWEAVTGGLMLKRVDEKCCADL